MSELKFKYLNEIDISSSLTDSAHVIVEDGGSIKRAPMNQLVVEGGVSSWNDLEDKPFYEEGSSEEILPETTLTMNILGSDGLGITTVDHTKIILGKTYKMVWDGVKYEAPAFEYSEQENDEVISWAAIGNPSFADAGEDNGVPFFGANYRNGSVIIDEFGVMTIGDTTTTHTLSISAGSTTIHTLDEKFIPSSIARVSDIPEGSAQVNPDWNQNDSTQPDYVKNRTHWVEGSGATIEWDGNTEGHEYVDSNNDGSMLWVHVSDITPSMSEFVGSVATVTMTDGSAMSNTITEDGITQYDQSISFGDGAISIAYVDNAAMGSFVLPKAGTYFVVNASMYVSKLTYGSTTYHPLDEAFIPDTIARSADIPEVNYPVTSVNGMTGDVVIEGGSGGGGVSSWNDLTDRPFYEENNQTIIEWDGNTEGLEPLNGLYYKVSDLTPSYEELVGCTMKTTVLESDGQWVDESVGENFREVQEVTSGALQIGSLAYVINVSGEDRETSSLPANGTYFYGVFADDMTTYVKSLTYGSTTIKTLDEKFIPDTIARKSDLQSGSGLPEVTTENNGAFLRVVDGAWAIVNMTDVSTEGA